MVVSEAQELAGAARFGRLNAATAGLILVVIALAFIYTGWRLRRAARTKGDDRVLLGVALAALAVGGVWAVFTHPRLAQFAGARGELTMETFGLAPVGPSGAAVLGRNN